MLRKRRTHRKSSFAKLQLERLEDRTVPSAFYQVAAGLLSPVGSDGRGASGDSPVSVSQEVSILPGSTGTNYFEGHEFAAAGQDALGASASIVENITPVGLMGPTGHGGHGESLLRYDDIVISGPPGDVTISLNLQFSGAPSVRAFNALPEATFIGAFDATAEIRVEGHLGFNTDVAAGPLEDFAGRIVSSGGWDGSFGGIGIGNVTTSGILRQGGGTLTTDPVVVPRNTTSLSLTLSLLAGGGLDAYVLGTGPVQPSLTFEIHNEGVTLGLPTSGPVFNLPPGYTVNSPDAGIVNNVIPPPTPSQTTPTITVAAAGGTYNGQPFPAVATATDASGTPVNGSFTFTYADGQGNSSANAPADAGTYTAVASFVSGDPHFTDAQSAPATFTIAPAPLVVTVADAAKVYGQDVSAALTGTITGIQNGDPITAAYASTGAGTGATPGAYAIDAVLSDGGTGRLARDYNVSVLPGTLTVNQDSTTTQMTSSANPSPYGQSVTFTATVTADTPGSGTPTGTVTFYDGTAVLGTATLSDGVAMFTAPKLAAGAHAISAIYSGDTDFLGSTAAVLTQRVLSAREQIVLLVSQVNGLVSDGVLNSGNGNALTAKLDAATASLDRGNTTAAVNQLDAFINQVIALRKSKKLTDAQAQPLIDAADQAIASALA